MSYGLHTSVSVLALNDGTIHIKESKKGRVFALKNCSPVARTFLAELQREVSSERLQRARENLELSPLTDLLEAEGWIVPRAVNPYAGEVREKLFRYVEAIHEAPATDVLESLARKKILIIGCGGTGSAVAQHLTASGVRNFVLIDDDKVQASNLNRQAMFTRADIGNFKTEALERALHARIPSLKIDRRELRIDGSPIVAELIAEHQPDFVFCGADLPAVRCHLWIAHACQENRVPCLFGGIGLREGFWGPLLSEGSHFDAFTSRMRLLAEKYNTESLAVVEGSQSMTNMLVSTLLAQDLFAFLTGGVPLSGGRKIKIEFATMQVSPA